MQQEQIAMGERMRQFAAAAEAKIQNEAAAAQNGLAKAEPAIPREHAREMERAVELHKEASVANEGVFER